MRNFAIAAIGTLALTPFAAQAHHGWGSYEASTPLVIEAPVESIVWETPTADSPCPTKAKSGT